ncbi:hypothetical protein LTR78_006780 [Recurvomyces mirabilis]|uniref:Uncharacterized protein n=1 Tax=Recurvomyces mirabilis TaxID=574656 RepID=A0AAE1BZ81_9PEZI|nr:hypothetical protein LTR78_006780 [Recurvomyces mirabilis]KAK5153230.1 hypothetical protein LTS14_007875 [Recurvomyces mirabilis]
MATFAHTIAARFRNVTRTVHTAIERAIRDGLPSQPPPVRGKPHHEGMSAALQLHSLRSRTDLQTRRVNFDEENVKKLLLEIGEEGHGLEERIKLALSKTGRGPLSKNMKSTSGKDLAEYVDLLVTSLYLGEWDRKESNVSFDEWVNDPLCPAVSGWKPLPYQLQGVDDQDSTKNGDGGQPVQASRRKPGTGIGSNLRSRLVPRTRPPVRPPTVVNAGVGQIASTFTATSTATASPSNSKTKRKADEIDDEHNGGDLLVAKRQAVGPAAAAKEPAAKASSAPLKAPAFMSAGGPKVDAAIISQVASPIDHANVSGDSGHTSAVDREKTLAPAAPKTLTTERVGTSIHSSHTLEAAGRWGGESLLAPPYSPLTEPGSKTPDFTSLLFVDYR